MRLTSSESLLSSHWRQIATMCCMSNHESVHWASVSVHKAHNGARGHQTSIWIVSYLLIVRALCAGGYSASRQASTWYTCAAVCVPTNHHARVIDVQHRRTPCAHIYAGTYVHACRRVLYRGGLCYASRRLHYSEHPHMHTFSLCE